MYIFLIHPLLLKQEFLSFIKTAEEMWWIGNSILLSESTGEYKMSSNGCDIFCNTYYML